MKQGSKRPIRVVQWATGTVGGFALRAIIEHPDLQLVGVHVYSDSKAGKDAGELCGLPDTGIKATRDVHTILELKPDCAVYMPDRTDPDEICLLLENGINLVTTRAEFFNPDLMDQGLRARVEAACQRGEASIHATGSSPGFITEVLPLAVTSLMRRVDLLTVEEFANCREGCSEEMLTQLMGFGDTPEAFAKRHTRDHAAFELSLGLIASAIGKPIERFEYTMDTAVCRNDTALHKSTIPAGTIGGQRITITGIHDGKAFMQFRSNWYVTKELEPAWDLKLPGDGWRLKVEGDTPVDMLIDLPMPIEADARASGRYTAHRPVNVVPYLVAAKPGIVPTTELPQIIANVA